jgi:hypothetical protein
VTAFDPQRYAEAAAAALDLPLPEHCKPGVAENLARLAAMADSLLSFDIPPDPS